jgi:hypothetical protein
MDRRGFLKGLFGAAVVVPAIARPTQFNTAGEIVQAPPAPLPDLTKPAVVTCGQIISTAHPPFYGSGSTMYSVRQCVGTTAGFATISPHYLSYQAD